MSPHYRVAIFGSARIQQGDQEYKDVFAMARGFGKLGFDVVTGGGPGIMLAGNAGHKSGMSNSHSIGLNIKLPFEQQENKYLDIKREFDRFSERLDTFMSLSDVIVVATGGVGTLLELFYSWQLIQVKHMCETPIILFGEMWGGLLQWLTRDVLARNLFNKEDMRNIFHMSDCEKVIEFVKKSHEDRQNMDHICINYDQYRMEFSPMSG